MNESGEGLAIIIPTYGAFEYALLTVQTAARSVPSARLIVVDDASPDWNTDWEAELQALSARISIKRYDENEGLTRSWNYGVQLALDEGFPYIAAGNADLRFPLGWWEPLRDVLDHGTGFVGPLTNAPGGDAFQDIRRYHTDYVQDHEQSAIDELQQMLLAKPTRQAKRSRLSGFLIAGSAEAFEAARFSEDDIYDPAYRMVGNEYQLQRLAAKRGITSRVALRSFVYHFRSVSRGLNNRRTDSGWSRLDECVEQAR